MSDTPDFITRAVAQLRATVNPDEGDTIVVATLYDGRMVMQTRTPRGPAELVHIARRLLEEARDLYDEAANTEGADPALCATAGDRAAVLDDALGILPDEAEIAEGEAA